MKEQAWDHEVIAAHRTWLERNNDGWKKFVKRWRGFLVLLLFMGGCSAVLLLGGCVGGSSMIIPSTEVIDSTGKVVTTTASTVGDASTYRTHQKYEAWRTAYTEYARAYKASGFTMKYQKVVLPNGDETYLPVISFKPPPLFIPPDDLKDHPVWGTIESVGGKLIDRTFWGWTVGAVVGGFKDMADKNGGRNEYVSSNGGDINFVSKRSHTVIGDSNTGTAISGINTDAVPAPEEPEEEIF